MRSRICGLGFGVQVEFGAFWVQVRRKGVSIAIRV